MELNSVDEILDFAIGKEKEAVEFYIRLAALVDSDHMRDLLLSFSKEERRHEALLTGVKQGKRLMPVKEKVLDLHISDYMPDEPKEEETIDLENLDYQEVLLKAMNREKAAFKFYSALAATAEDDEVKELFEGLAQEEAKHKLHFEIEYDEHILTEN